MIAASVKDGEKLVDFLLSKGADPNEKSEALSHSRLVSTHPTKGTGGPKKTRKQPDRLTLAD